MADYLLKNVSGKKKAASATPGMKRATKTQAKNNAGGFGWKIDDWTQLTRFLILGSEGGTFYVNERKLTKTNVKALKKCLKADGLRTVKTIVEISKAGRAPKNDEALFALAYAISEGDLATKRAAAAALPEVARIGTHLYTFLDYVQTMRGWGALLRWAVANWYESKPAEKLAYDAIKYRQRNGWTHRDVLRQAHPSGANDAIYEWITHGVALTKAGNPKKAAWNALPDQIRGFEAAQVSPDAKHTAELVRAYNLPREALQTEHLNSSEVWEAMLDQGMPMTALIRNLPTMTRNGILKSADYKKIVVEQLQNQDALKRARVHPLQVLVALKTYAQGRPQPRYGTWTTDASKNWKPDGKIIDALDDAFYLSFGNITPVGKHAMLGIDISGSMGNVFGDTPLTCAEAAAAMAMVAVRTEPEVTVGKFNHTMEIVKGLSPKQRLDDALKTIFTHWNGGGTDCAQPMVWAKTHDKTIETFSVYTDNETWAGKIQPFQALKDYRQVSGKNARSVVVGMAANAFTIADPDDAGMLDVVGFDTATPALISEFFSGNI